jgi:hypothetical protein
VPVCGGTGSQSTARAGRGGGWEKTGIPSRDLQGSHDQFVQDEQGERDADDIQKFGPEKHEGDKLDGRAGVHSDQTKERM